MNFFTARLIALLSAFYLVTSESALDTIIDIRPRPTNDSTANKFMYFEQAKLRVECSLRSSPYPEGVHLNLFYEIAEQNPVLGQNGLPKIETVDEKTLKIQFWPNIFISLINFTCTSKQLIETKWQILATSNLLVEQLYRTSFVEIVDHQDHDTPKVITMDSDETVELKCLADGNPQPSNYQWYNRTEYSDDELADQKEAIFQFVPASDWASESLIFCVTKNKFNEETLSSAPVTVISHYFPRIVFTSEPIPSNMSTLEKIVFMEDKKVIVECHFATTSPPGIYIEIKMNSYEKNPVFPEEHLQYNTTDKPTMIEIYYDLDKVIPLVNISCHAINETTALARKVSTVIIEQQSRTRNVKISGPSKVERGQKFSFECVADGYPRPQLQWFIETRDGFEAIINEANQVLRLDSYNMASGTTFMCGAKNKYNFEFARSPPKQVTIA